MGGGDYETPPNTQDVVQQQLTYRMRSSISLTNLAFLSAQDQGSHSTRTVGIEARRRLLKVAAYCRDCKREGDLFRSLLQIPRSTYLIAKCCICIANLSHRVSHNKYIRGIYGNLIKSKPTLHSNQEPIRK